MRYLTLYTPDDNGPPTAAHMETMTKFVEEMYASGELVVTGPLGMRATGGMRIRRKDGQREVIDDPAGESVLLSAAGFAILEATDREALIDHVDRFLTVAGDGSVEIIRILDGPPPTD